MTCNCCLGMASVNHKCRENCLETNCPVCNEFLFTSSSRIKALPCGHYMHLSCFKVSISLAQVSYVFTLFSLFLLKTDLDSGGIKSLILCYVCLGLHSEPESLHLSSLQQIFRSYDGNTSNRLMFMPIFYKISIFEDRYILLH